VACGVFNKLKDWGRLTPCDRAPADVVSIRLCKRRRPATCCRCAAPRRQRGAKDFRAVNDCHSMACEACHATAERCRLCYEIARGGAAECPTAARARGNAMCGGLSSLPGRLRFVRAARGARLGNATTHCRAERRSVEECRGTRALLVSPRLAAGSAHRAGGRACPMGESARSPHRCQRAPQSCLNARHSALAGAGGRRDAPVAGHSKHHQKTQGVIQGKRHVGAQGGRGMHV